MTTIRKTPSAAPAKPVAQVEPKLEFFDVEADSKGWTAPPAKFAPKDRAELPAVTGPRATVIPGPPSAAPALAFALSRAAGTRDSAQLLAKLPGLNDSLKSFAPLASNATPAEQEKIAFAALRHFAVKSGSPLTPALTQALGGSNEAIASAYARDLGFQGVRKQGDQWQLLGAGDAPVKLKAGAGSVAELGKAINEARFANASGTPPLAAINAAKPKFGLEEAHLATHLASLAYQPKEVVKAQLEKWGYDTSTFKWIENKSTDTQGFVVADRKGNVFPVFRGTVSARDWQTNGQTLMSSPSWMSEVKTHGGFAAALDSVWPEMKAGIEQAKRKAGTNAKVMFAGHSLGGALTQLAAVRAEREGIVDGANASIYTIGSPRVGNQAFKDQLESKFPNTFRIANYEDGFVAVQDLVTQVPPKSIGYRHAGQMVRLGGDQIKLVDRSSSAAGLADPDQDDPVNTGLENLRGDELSKKMQELMGGATAVPPSSDAGDEGAMREVQVLSVLAHSSGVYLDRIAHHAGH